MDKEHFLASNELLREALLIALQYVPLGTEDSDTIDKLVKEACKNDNPTGEQR